MYPFFLLRHEDVSGTSGTGVVAYGVVLPSGKAVMEWNSRWQTITIFDSLQQVRRLHGHGGRTEVCLGFPEEAELARGFAWLERLRRWRHAIWPRLILRPPAVSTVSEKTTMPRSFGRPVKPASQGLARLSKSPSKS
jgi:hypothetical protein